MIADNTQTRWVMWPLFLLLSAALQGCLLPAEDYERMAILGHIICDGDGHQKALFCGKDHFGMMLEPLDHPKKDVRVIAANNLKTNTGWAGTQYTMLADAYIDAGRGGELMEALWHAWRNSPWESVERYRMAEAFVDCRSLQYVSEHPGIAGKMGFDRRPGRRGWRGSLWRRRWQYLAPKVLEEGDERFQAVWTDYQRLEKIIISLYDEERGMP